MADQIQEIKSALDIVQVIGERIQLQRAGKNFKALCPFHAEKTPSFFVTPEMQRYKCFGCGRSGDIFTFLQEYDSLTFAEALQQLADQAGIRLERTVFSDEDRRRQRYYEILDLAKEYYHYVLTKHKLGAPARTYLEQRGLHAETIATFQLGYALNSWEALQDYLVKKKKYDWRDLESVGLVIRRSGGSRGVNSTGANNGYDRFRHRIMFPLTDAQGRTVGFSGRVLDAETKEAKYINTPETTLYHKSELLFGYSILKNFIRKAEEVLVMEGEFDVLSSYQAEVKHVVAIKGSALTEQHVRLLARSVKRITLALDSDSAGVEATKRAIKIIQDYDLHLRVLPLEIGKDPDEMARAYPKAWRETQKKSKPAYSFLIDAAFRNRDVASPEHKKEITREVFPILNSIENAVEQAHYLSEISRRLGVKEEVLESEMQRFSRKQAITPAKSSRRSSQETTPTRVRSIPPGEPLERYLVTLLLHAPEDSRTAWLDSVASLAFSTPSLGVLVEHIRKSVADRQFDPSVFAATVPPEYQELLSEIYLYPLAEDLNLVHEWKATFHGVQKTTRSRRLRELADRIAILEEKEPRTATEDKQLEKLRNDLQRVTTEA